MKNRQNYTSRNVPHVCGGDAMRVIASGHRFGKWLFAGIAGSVKRNALLPVDKNSLAPISEQGSFNFGKRRQKDKNADFFNIGFPPIFGLKKTKVAQKIFWLMESG